jgi:hypothetical protein
VIDPAVEAAMDSPEIQAAVKRWDTEPPPRPLTSEQQDIITAAFAGAFPKRKGGVRT